MDFVACNGDCTEEGTHCEGCGRSHEEIAELKMKDLNTSSLEAAMRIIEGSARTMGIEVVE